MDQFDDAPEDFTGESVGLGKRQRSPESQRGPGTAPAHNGAIVATSAHINSGDETGPVTNRTIQQPANGKSRVRKKLKKKAAEKYASLMTCLQHAMFTGSVYIEASNSGKVTQQDRATTSSAAAALSLLKVITCSDFPRNTTNHNVPINSATIRSFNEKNTIYIQPLLILDLNGILCHRIRPGREPTGILRYRAATHQIAGTPIIPRTDLEHFLTFLDQHFCLAVFTSAKQKNAKKLVEALFPETVAQNLLFVWGQNRCNGIACVAATDDYTTTIFEKNLDLVWSEYPLWNARNTLLIDDSPEKCLHWRRNAVHPPSIHGQLEREPATAWLKPDGLGVEPSSSTVEDDECWMLDVENERQQMDFFSKLVEFWKANPYQTAWTDEGELQQNSVASELALWNFLQDHASGHMGWGE